MSEKHFLVTMILKTDLARLIFSLMAALILLSSCTTNPQSRQRQICPTCAPIELKIPGDLSPILAQTITPSIDSQRLHIYLEGDGRPWTRNDAPSDEPNSRQLTALKLMTLDNQNRIYLNRPCYGVMPMASACKTRLWTSGRYSSEVVQAMSRALDQIQKEYAATELVLIGHSGGGTLAMLIAALRNDVVAVITLAANLDHQAWTEFFAYLPLTDSLNAVDVKLAPHVLRWHVAAGNDKQVPAELIKRATKTDPHARYREYKNFDHTCCWQTVWPKVLEDLTKELKTHPSLNDR
jgi:pimeloyl-ACP methyl ester carboxylesterase